MIAIENVRLFEEVQARTRDLTEALQQQTATADVLKAISRTAFDLDTVLETLISTAVRLCDASHGQIFRRHGDVYRYAASQMVVDPIYLQYEQTTEIKPGRGTLIGRVALENARSRSPMLGTTRNTQKRPRLAWATFARCLACRSCGVASRSAPLRWRAARLFRLRDVKSS